MDIILASNKKKLIVDCDPEYIDWLMELSAAADRPKAWIVRRLIAHAYNRVFYSDGVPSIADEDVLYDMGLVGNHELSRPTGRPHVGCQCESIGGRKLADILADEKAIATCDKETTKK